METTLIIDKITDGIVIDHIKAGEGVRVFNWLGLEKSTHTIAFIVNAISASMGHKDIIKIYDTISLDYDILGLIDPNISVNIIKNHVVIEKRSLTLPERVQNVMRCKNPRCITSTEGYVPQIFHLADRASGLYRCEYCDEVQTTEEFNRGIPLLGHFV
jgi:aspartate carbamoyltransferase regulatory subunit